MENTTDIRNEEVVESVHVLCFYRYHIIGLLKQTRHKMGRSRKYCPISSQMQESKGPLFMRIAYGLTQTPINTLLAKKKQSFTRQRFSSQFHKKSRL